MARLGDISPEIRAQIEAERAIGAVLDEGARRRILIYLCATFAPEKPTPDAILAAHRAGHDEP
jgi:hypothetical protein